MIFPPSLVHGGQKRSIRAMDSFPGSYMILLSALQAIIAIWLVLTCMIKPLPSHSKMPSFLKEGGKCKPETIFVLYIHLLSIYCVPDTEY